MALRFAVAHGRALAEHQRRNANRSGTVGELPGGVCADGEDQAERRTGGPGAAGAGAHAIAAGHGRVFVEGGFGSGFGRAFVQRGEPGDWLPVPEWIGDGDGAAGTAGELHPGLFQCVLRGVDGAGSGQPGQRVSRVHRCRVVDRPSFAERDRVERGCVAFERLFLQGTRKKDRDGTDLGFRPIDGYNGRRRYASVQSAELERTELG